MALAPEKNEPVSDKLIIHQIRRRATIRGEVSSEAFHGISIPFPSCDHSYRRL
ncbi:hypothetical protein Krac_5738 [Ktedonobacter racemifer DSM 44963]|uniref:Uncharacterized protein n=1 Tax=Ktedonobacter racemifer DSM 44963 TaxID=485913 RepID=D6TWR2_KTERA|nr:hypothetical protein Krac_5738 [Ktedonobacter racemifer DSM 44963]